MLTVRDVEPTEWPHVDATEQHIADNGDVAREYFKEKQNGVPTNNPDNNNSSDNKRRD